MSERLERKLHAHVATYQAARIVQAIAAVGTLIWSLWDGLPALILGAIIVWFFGLAVPGPDPELDRYTGRIRK